MRILRSYCYGDPTCTTKLVQHTLSRSLLRSNILLHALEQDVILQQQQALPQDVVNVNVVTISRGIATETNAGMLSQVQDEIRLLAKVDGLEVNDVVFKVNTVHPLLDHVPARTRIRGILQEKVFDIFN